MDVRPCGAPRVPGDDAPPWPLGLS